MYQLKHEELLRNLFIRMMRRRTMNGELLVYLDNLIHREWRMSYKTDAR